MPSMTGRPRHARQVLIFVLITVSALAVLVGGVVVAGYVLLANPFCAKPPTQEERHQQEAFVLAHLPDASDFEWTVMDCDDNGQAYLSFSTRLTRDAASAVFLRDPACKASTEVDASPEIRPAGQRIRTSPSTSMTPRAASTRMASSTPTNTEARHRTQSDRETETD